MLDLIQAVKRPIESKSERHLAGLKQMLISMEVFKKLQHPLTNEDISFLCKIVKYQYAPKGTKILKAGHKNDKLFYIMRGKVLLSLPNGEKICQDKHTGKGRLTAD